MPERPLPGLSLQDRRTFRAKVIVDVGCGHGLFAQLLAGQIPKRRVIGFDLDAHKIGLAAQLSAAGKGL